LTTKDTKGAKGSEDVTLDAILEFGVVEVDEQANIHASQFHLRVTNGKNLRVLRE